MMCEGALGNLLRLIGMPVRDSLHPRDHLVHPRVVFHGAGTQGIHTQVNGIVPRGKSREMTDDLDLAHFRHVAEFFSFIGSQKLGGIHFGHVQRRQLPGGLACRRLLEDQAFVLIHLEGGFAGRVLHRATSSTSSALEDPHGPLALGHQSHGCVDGAARRQFRTAPHGGVPQFGIELLQRQTADHLMPQQPLVYGVGIFARLHHELIESRRSRRTEPCRVSRTGSQRKPPSPDSAWLIPSSRLCRRRS